MFNDYVILHTPPPNQPTTATATAAAAPPSGGGTASNSAEQTTQTTSDSSIWQVNLPNQPTVAASATSALADCSDLALSEATMTCQELLAFSVAFSAALPTNQTTLETFYSSLAKADSAAQRPIGHGAVADDGPLGAALPADAAQRNGLTQTAATAPATTTATAAGTAAIHPAVEDFSCCLDLYMQAKYTDGPTSLLRRRSSTRPRNRYVQSVLNAWRMVAKVLSYVRRGVRRLVEQKYFQQGILLAILINTLSMGIEYHNQPEELTAIVETSNVVFSVIFACEMLLKVVAEGPFRYIANGFNVFDGVIVILR